MVDTSDKYWLCSNCGKIYPEPCYYKPPADCGFECTPYANGNGYKPHRWQEISQRTFNEKIEEIREARRLAAEAAAEAAAAREAARKRASRAWCFFLIFASALAVICIIYLKQNDFKIRDQHSSGNTVTNSSANNNYSHKAVISDSKLDAINHALFSCSDYKAVRGSQNSAIIHDIKNNGFDLTFNGNRTFLFYLKNSFQRDGIYLSNENSNSVLIIKPTFEGYESYEFNKSSGAGSKRHVATYNCGSFNLGSRYYFLKVKPVNTDFTNLYPADELKLIRNSIFAAHGYVFKSEDLTNYFRKYPWYNPGNNSLDDYTDYEKSNIKFIKKVEDGLKK